MCLVFLRGRTTLDFNKCSFFVLLLSLFRSCRRNNDFALVLGAVGVGHSCPPYLGTLIQRVQVVGVGNVLLTLLVTFVRVGLAQWEAFLKKCSYSGCRKSRPSGSDLPAAPPTLPPSTSASSEAERPAPPTRLTLPPPPPPSEGRGRSGETEGAPCVVSRGVSSPPSHRSVGEEGGGGGGFGSWERG